MENNDLENNRKIQEQVQRAENIKNFINKHVFYDTLKYDNLYNTAEVKIILSRTANLPILINRIDVYQGTWVGDYPEEGYFNGKHLQNFRKKDTTDKFWYLNKLLPFLNSNETLSYYIGFEIV